jgi:GMP synthase (glutamine-hydrolysing)
MPECLTRATVTAADGRQDAGMPTWTFLQHVRHEPAALIATMAAERGVTVDVRVIPNGDPLPAADDLDGLVVMGGPMGAHDDAAHPNLPGERALLAAAVHRGIPVLGVCLGAQLLAAALGARVYRGPTLEVGLAEVEVIADDPVLGAAGTRLPAMHWHHDTFDLPTDATWVARSAQYPHQAFRLGERAWGLQFHVELDRALSAAWAPHLPGGVTIDEPGRQAVEDYGRGALGRFFDLVLEKRSPSLTLGG